jgi:hypothetical protein
MRFHATLLDERARGGRLLDEVAAAAVVDQLERGC